MRRRKSRFKVNRGWTTSIHRYAPNSPAARLCAPQGSVVQADCTVQGALHAECKAVQSINQAILNGTCCGSLLLASLGVLASHLHLVTGRRASLEEQQAAFVESLTGRTTYG
jgi:hypothetical protein